MDFNISYQETMDSFALGGSFSNLYTEDARAASAYIASLKATIKPGEFVFPSAMSRIIIPPQEEDAPLEVIAPLYISDCGIKTCSGAETLLKTMCRMYNTRLRSFKLKEDMYYGSKGILLDSALTPLILSTVRVEVGEYGLLTPREYIIHIHPSVFTKETTLNKSIARKGVAFYLSHSLTTWDATYNVQFRVVIDDSSDFYVKPSKPDITSFSNTDVNDFLKKHIDEVLTQLISDT